MKFVIRLWVRLSLIVFIMGPASLCVVSQTAGSKDVQPTPAQVSGKRTTADESFELNIDQRQFTRTNFEVSTAVGTTEDAALNLQIGVGLAASRIEVVLKNVQGRVRFRGTIERILEIINNRRPASPE